MKTQLKFFLAFLLLSCVFTAKDVEGTMTDLSEFTDENAADAGVLAAIRTVLVDKAVSIKNKVPYDGEIAYGGMTHKVKYFRIGSAVHFYVYGTDGGKEDLVYRVYMNLPNTDKLYFVPKKCELIKSLNNEPPALKKCGTAKLVADDLTRMLTESAAKAGKDLNEAQKTADDLVECIKKNVDAHEVGIQCLEEGVKMDPEWYRQQLTAMAEALKAQGKKVTIEGTKLVVQG